MRRKKSRWLPSDQQLPMTAVEQNLVTGFVVTVCTGLLTLLCLYGILVHGNHHPTEEIVMGLAFAFVFGAACLFGLSQLYYKRTILIEPTLVTITLRRLFRKTVVDKVPLKEYLAICRMDVTIGYTPHQSLILPGHNISQVVCLATLRPNDPKLPQLHDHFSKLLGLPNDDFTFSAIKSKSRTKRDRLRKE